MFNLVFETKTNDGSEILAAVDNLSITKGSCLSIGMFYFFKCVCISHLDAHSQHME